ncbi:unnamed protein product [Rhizophagus irregularis]|nr:unnamed protein product [Rhizophagus irregularis]CAB4443231.1 unnamed protein product [Rhizophagus irregularis]
MDLLKTYLDPDDEPNDKLKPRKGINNSFKLSSETSLQYQKIYVYEVENQKNFTTSDGAGSDVWIKDFSTSDDIVVTEDGDDEVPKNWEEQLKEFT